MLFTMACVAQVQAHLRGRMSAGGRLRVGVATGQS